MSEKNLNTLTKKQLIDLIEKKEVVSADNKEANPLSGLENVLLENRRLKSLLEKKNDVTTYVGIENLSNGKVWLPAPQSSIVGEENASDGVLLKGKQKTIIPTHWLVYYISIDLSSFVDGTCRVNNSFVRNNNPNLVVGEVEIPDSFLKWIMTDVEVNKLVDGQTEDIIDFVNTAGSETLCNRVVLAIRDKAEKFKKEENKPKYESTILLADQVEGILYERFHKFDDDSEKKIVYDK